MDIQSLEVQMLGRFAVRLNGQEINDNDNRSKKVWLLLAYMIYFRNRSITQSELVHLLWSEDEGSSNPINALKTMFHRVRAMLDQLAPSAGHTLIIRKEGSYAWNTEIPFRFDLDEFEALCKSSASCGDEKTLLQNHMAALKLYQGDFLPKLSSEPWIVPINTYFHNLYVQTVLNTLSQLERSNRLPEAVQVAREAVVLEPYHEVIYRHLMRDLLDLGDQSGAISVYQNMSELMFSNFGIMPSEEIKALYREAMRTVNDRELSMAAVLEQLREPDQLPGALLCDYDFFKVLYHAEARSIARSGRAVHIGLLSVSAANGESLPKRSLDICMENLQSLIRGNLRRGDIASRCSVSQFIMMLPQANYENACMVMDRIVKAFFRQYPHSPAILRTAVQPLEPSS